MRKTKISIIILLLTVTLGFNHRSDGATTKSLWIATAGNVTAPSGTPGLSNWLGTAVLNLGDPNLALEPDSTVGTFSSIVDFFPMIGDGESVIADIHYVSRDIVIGSTPSYQLLNGDMLIAFESFESLTSVNNIITNADQLLVFRPTTLGDYSVGSWFILLDNPIGQGFGGFTLIEENVTIGDYGVVAGNFLMSTFGSNDIYYVEISGVGTGATVTTSSRIIEASDIDLGSGPNGINSLELTETSITLGGSSIPAGQIIFGLEEADLSVGISNPISVTKYDLVALIITQTELGGSGLSQATASLVFEGADIGLETTTSGPSGTYESIGAFSFYSDSDTVLSVNVSNTNFSFGFSVLDSWLPALSSVIINDGNTPEDFVAQISQFTDASNVWNVSPTENGADSICAQWSTVSSSGPWTNISAYSSDFTIATNVAVADSVTLWFRIETPTSTSSFNEFSSAFTVTALAY